MMLFPSIVQYGKYTTHSNWGDEGVRVYEERGYVISLTIIFSPLM